MRITPKTRTVAGLSLAAAVAGTVAIAPVQAQEPTETTPAPASTQEKVDTGAVVRGINGIQQNLEKLNTKVVRPGSGTAHARYSVSGWTYTAAAYNPVNNRIYAISTGENGKPAGHLLRMFTDREGVSDLGALSLGADFPTNTIASAAFTSRGELVLFSGPNFRVFDLSKDKVEGEVTNIAAVRARTGELLLDDGVGNVGVPSAWASVVADGKAKELYAVSRDPQGAPYLWTLNIDSGRVQIAPLQVATGVDLEPIGELNYAFTKDAKDAKSAATLVFADDQARTIEVRDGAVVATYLGREIVDNFREIAYLPKGAGYKAMTQFAKPAPEAAEAAAAPAGEGVQAYDTAVPSIPTVIAPQFEPTASPVQTAQVEAGAPAPAEVADRPVVFTVVDEKGHSQQGVDIEIEGTDISGVTDKNGQAKLDVPGVDVVANVDGAVSVVRADAQSHRVTLLADKTVSVTPNAEGVYEAHKLAVTVKDVNGLAVEGATVTGLVGTTEVSVQTNKAGLAEIDIPELKTKEAYSFKVSKDGTVQDFTATSDDQAKSVTMANLIIATAPVTTTTSGVQLQGVQGRHRPGLHRH
ncbi:hypothetical protein JZY91_11470 [Corynebacterium sp. CNCTC7651]|uniref:hypothetical protein n=1 Tax=Corynebacterium sp. CNCTC7651 TaxID=2815361 RepID=UPI001F46CECA|nr:hypothetical protein [Corynebacterium sp. CNCTC7651]UIZ92231.1 hypothetical protein JZY91_11470 [Corynebacterium sp. CNCTC7651]